MGLPRRGGAHGWPSLRSRRGQPLHCAPHDARRPRMATTLLQSDLPGLTLRHRGKVRDVFDLGNDTLLMVATDRLSAFDVVLPDPIPGKGEMLCQISNFWFDKTRHIIANHLTGIDVASVLPAGVDPALYAKRAVVTKKLTPVPVECIARGYVIGSGWKDYQRSGAISGIDLPQGLQQAQQLDTPIFTPSTKAAVGDHDENIDFATAINLVGREMAEAVRDATLAIYSYARDYAAQRGAAAQVQRPVPVMAVAGSPCTAARGKQ